MKFIFKSVLIAAASTVLAGCSDVMMYSDPNPTRVYNTGVAPAEVIHDNTYYTTAQTPPAPPVSGRAVVRQTPPAPSAGQGDDDIPYEVAAPLDPNARASVSSTPAAPAQ